MIDATFKWEPISTAPKNREIIVFCLGTEGLNDLVSFCKWHPEAGFCVDELREPVAWTEHPLRTIIKGVLKEDPKVS